MEKVWDIANLYVATLRAIYLIEQHCHWTTKGLSFYGDHLLFERLYKSAQDNADLAAEKFIGLFGEECLDYTKQAELMDKVLKKYADVAEHPVKQALTVEKDFLEFAEKAFKALEKEGSVSLGLDDAFTGISNDRETACYLLSQTLTKSAKVKMAQDLKSYLDIALSTSLANNNLAVSFRGDLQGNTYTIICNPPLDNGKKNALLNSLKNYIKTNRPQLESQIVFKFA